MTQRWHVDDAWRESDVSCCLSFALQVNFSIDHQKSNTLCRTSVYRVLFKKIWPSLTGAATLHSCTIIICIDDNSHLPLYALMLNYCAKKDCIVLFNCTCGSSAISFANISSSSGKSTHVASETTSKPRNLRGYKTLPGAMCLSSTIGMHPAEHSPLGLRRFLTSHTAGNGIPIFKWANILKEVVPHKSCNAWCNLSRVMTCGLSWTAAL